MEQTNLVVTPDGKTWDEVTRDTSYLGNTCLVTDFDDDSGSWGLLYFQEFRGTNRANHYTNLNKDWAIAYDRFICLVDGHYRVTFQGLSTANGGVCSAYIYIMSAGVTSAVSMLGAESDPDSGARGNVSLDGIYYCKRGDHLSLKGTTLFGSSDGGCNLIIERVIHG